MFEYGEDEWYVCHLDTNDEDADWCEDECWSYQEACELADKIKEQFPNEKIYIKTVEFEKVS